MTAPAMSAGTAETEGLGAKPASAVRGAEAPASTPQPIPAGEAVEAKPGQHPTAYYNEIEPYAAQWIRNLSDAGHIAPGQVDTRSVVDLRPADVAGYAQFHTFAGIAGWSLALRLAGVPDDFPVWTGSCPCQPFSAAGRRGGFSDERHLWPAWFELIDACRPALVFGEQVASKDGLAWLDAVFADLEGAGYACRAADLCAAGVGAPHIRQRLWFVANASGQRHDRKHALLRQEAAGRIAADLPEATRGGEAHGLAYAENGGCSWSGAMCKPTRRYGLAYCGADGLVGDTTSGQQRHWAPEAGLRREVEARGSSPWDDPEWIPCRDGKARPTRPGLQPLAHGVSARVGKLRAAGNAIVPQVAAAFISAALDALTDPAADPAARALPLTSKEDRT